MTLCRAATEADGRFALAAVPPGIAVRVVAIAPGHRLGMQAPSVLRPGEQVDGLVLRLLPR